MDTPTLGSSRKSMFSRGVHEFYAFFLAPKSADEDDRRREYILNVILAGTIAMIGIFETVVIGNAFVEGSSYQQAYQHVPVIIFSAIFLFFVFLLFLSRRGYYAFVSYLLVIGYLVSDGYAAYQWGIDLHIVVLSYALIVLMANTLIGTRFGFLTAGIIAAAIIPLRYFQMSGAILVRTRHGDFFDAVSLSIVVFLIMVLAWLWNHEVEKSLHRARKSESALKEERDMLEMRVDERTEVLRQTQFESMSQFNQFVEFGQLASGLFHDLLNLVNAASLVDEVKVSVEQKAAMGKRVDGFAQAIRRQLNCETTQELFSLEEGVEYVLQLLSYKALKGSVKMVFAQKGDRILSHFGDPFKFHQIMMNLVLNALDAGGSSVEIMLRQRGKVIELQVTDNGRGISGAIRAKIFEPFFTTKQAGKGKSMGIGLATVKKFVEKDFSGTISVESQEGRGSVFTVEFPVKTVEAI